MQAEGNLEGKTEQKGGNEINRKDAIKKITEKEVNAVGFLKATCLDLNENHFYREIVDGWVDLFDQDHQAKLDGNDLLLELWFFGTQFDEKAKLDTRQLQVRGGDIRYQTKLRVKVAEKDLDYVTVDGKRYYMEEE